MSKLLTKEESVDFIKTYSRLLRSVGDIALPGDKDKIKEYIEKAVAKNGYGEDVYGFNILLRNIHTALIITEEIGLKRTSVIAVLLSSIVIEKLCTLDDITKDFGADVSKIIHGLMKIHELYEKNAAIDNENFRTLLLSFAEDVRVILILIAERLYLMRSAKQIKNETYRLQIAAEASYLYAPLSHKLGLYKIKSDLEDLSLKFRDRERYLYIKDKLSETKRSRDEYIAEFIAPIEKRLKEMNLNFDIKGRTKSIHSINNKLIKQQIEFEKIYDLFAIRIILDTPLDKEKAECWQVYSVVTDMYQPNPKRMKDWLSVPKSNGYESLHTTVMGSGGRWVEVQIRTKRMDEIAEKGLAAHWKYKGLKGESGFDSWLNNVREVLENKDESPAELIDNFKMDLYDDEIFVFTPKGDLFKLPHNATILDFAFAIHTSVGAKCVSGKVNGKNVSIKQKLQSGDQVDILTSQNQTPKQDWLNFVVTSKARIKIKQSLKEQDAKQSEFAKELLKRRFKNRKIEEDEATLMRLIKKMGYKTVTKFYADIANDRLDVNAVIDQYQERKEHEALEHSERSVENYQARTTPVEEISTKEDVLVIDRNLTGIDYKLAKCCNPIYGDDIFGFVSSQGIKIHRTNCPNAPTLFSKYGYRVVKSRWAGKSGASYPVVLRVVGHDDIGIVTNITSIISKESGMMLRSINVDSQDGIFQGTITVLLSDTSMLNSLIKKIKAIKGVKQAERV
ncbi:guanosine-3',5'-bis(diphosphate) 3'-pyrophosphohydrolase [Dysgonomonadaceae bacterium PH5-43]|nr:guanosine-3',5'-bis(diphosphate) 3'-pyrophosphohydrolase [Dysgonomonadaceae bacterium PH5-43]